MRMPNELGGDRTRAKPRVHHIVSCSKPVNDDKTAYEQVQPPHIQARNSYEIHPTQVDGRKFLVTMSEPNSSQPKPPEFEFASSGLSLKKSVVVGSPAIITSTAPRAG
jgi:hypothetical protein